MLELQKKYNTFIFSDRKDYLDRIKIRLNELNIEITRRIDENILQINTLNNIITEGEYDMKINELKDKVDIHRKYLNSIFDLNII